MRTAFQGAVAQTLPVYDLILLLKVARDGACLTSSSRLFQSLGPRKDIALCPLLVFRKGIERSVCAETQPNTTAGQAYGSHNALHEKKRVRLSVEVC